MLEFEVGLFEPEAGAANFRLLDYKRLPAQIESAATHVSSNRHVRYGCGRKPAIGGHPAPSALKNKMGSESMFAERIRRKQRAGVRRRLPLGIRDDHAADALINRPSSGYSRRNKKALRCRRAFVFKPGDFLLSHIVAYAVPSGLRGLTSVFGMGTGGSPSLRSPRTW
jgi:hypothetical protein